MAKSSNGSSPGKCRSCVRGKKKVPGSKMVWRRVFSEDLQRYITARVEADDTKWVKCPDCEGKG